MLHETANHIRSEASQHRRQLESRYEDDTQYECLRVFKTSTYEKFKSINPNRAPGTCMWVLQHPRYTKWQQNSQDDVLWISADPGCGKSVLAKSLIDNELQDTETHVVCHFFFKDNEEQDSVSRALCALLHQLFERRPELLRHAMTKWKSNKDRLQNEEGELWRILIAAAADSLAPDITCVLDALDECREVERTGLIQRLTEFYDQSFQIPQRTSRLKFLLTSRPYDDIERGFRAIPAHLPAMRLLGEDENETISMEINEIIKARVVEVSNELELDENVQIMLEERLLSMTHRTYLWLHLVIEEVRSSLTRNLKGISGVIGCLPETVHDAYEMLLRRNTKKPRDRRDAQRVLHIILAARRPLLLKELDVAFQVASDNSAGSYNDLNLDRDHLAKRIRHLCGLFVFIKDARAYLIHQTAKEFLVAKNQVTETEYRWKYSLRKDDSERVMATVCIRYLRFTDFDEPRAIEKTALSKEEENASSRSPAYDFIGYSESNWPFHFQNAKPEEKDPLQQEVLRLCEADSKGDEIWFVNIWAGDELRNMPRVSKVFHSAARAGLDVMVQLLLQSDKINVNLKDRSDQAPLHNAAFYGHEKVAKLLLQSSTIDVNLQDTSDQAPLHNAAYNGHEKVAKLLLPSSTIDVNLKNKSGNAPLHLATIFEHKEVMKLLLDTETVNVNSLDRLGRTPLHLAITFKRKEAVKLLLDTKKVLVDSLDKRGRTPLQLATEREDHEIIELLRSHLPPTRKSRKGWIGRWRG
jgi:ankyrin repeat domain-containing protein 50